MTTATKTLTMRETGEVVELIQSQKVTAWPFRIVYTVRHQDGRVHNYTWETVRRTLPSD